MGWPSRPATRGQSCEQAEGGTAQPKCIMSTLHIAITRCKKGMWPRHVVIRHLIGSVTTSVQRGNAVAWLSGYSRV